MDGQSLALLRRQAAALEDARAAARIMADRTPYTLTNEDTRRIGAKLAKEKQMTIDDFCKMLDAQGSEYTRDGNKVSVKGPLYLPSQTTLPKGVTLSAGGWLELQGLTTLPEGVTLSAGRSLYLPSLTTLPEGVTLSAGRSLYLHNLTNEMQKYQGQMIRLRTVDGHCMRLIRSRNVGDITVWSAQYFRGHLDTDKRCYVAQMGDTYAHGESTDEAILDLRFKLAQADFDPEELIETIRQRGTVTFNDYRLLTGACREGLEEGLRSLGKEGVQEMPVTDALRLCAGHYGGKRFRALLNGAP